MITSAQINELLGISEAFHASYKLKEIMVNEPVREELFKKFLKIESDLSHDWFNVYFQEEHADRKGKKQDFTPVQVSSLLSQLLGPTVSNADICSGTGGLTIQRWNDNEDANFYCEEFSDRAIPFLLFNLAIRNVNAIVRHGDSLKRSFKRTYKLSKAEQFSEIEEIKGNDDSQYDTVIMNPPYSMPWDPKKEYLEQSRFSSFEALAPKSKSDFAFLLQGYHFLKEDGKYHKGTIVYGYRTHDGAVSIKLDNGTDACCSQKRAKEFIREVTNDGNNQSM